MIFIHSYAPETIRPFGPTNFSIASSSTSMKINEKMARKKKKKTMKEKKSI